MCMVVYMYSSADKYVYIYIRIYIIAPSIYLIDDMMTYMTCVLYLRIDNTFCWS